MNYADQVLWWDRKAVNKKQGICNQSPSMFPAFSKFPPYHWKAFFYKYFKTQQSEEQNFSALGIL